MKKRYKGKEEKPKHAPETLVQMPGSADQKDSQFVGKGIREQIFPNKKLMELEISKLCTLY